MSIEIKNRFTGAVIYAGEYTNTGEAVKAAMVAKANLSGADLSGANLYGANLYGANLYGADLYGANLYGANLYGADLYGANLSGANLYGANLYGANLYGADLSDANLSGANLYGADLSGANLSGAVDNWAQAGFMAHGECGRMLTAIKRPDSDIELFCGCFTGSVEKLREYIATSHEKYKASRTLALDTVLALLNFSQQEGGTVA